MVNPAWGFCAKNGGDPNLEGMCVFETKNGSVACGAWALMAGDCTVKTALPTNILFTVQDTSTLFIIVSGNAYHVCFGKFGLMWGTPHHKNLSGYVERREARDLDVEQRKQLRASSKRQFLTLTTKKLPIKVTAWWPRSKNRKEGSVVIGENPLHSVLASIFTSVRRDPSLQTFTVNGNTEEAYAWIEFWARTFGQGFRQIDCEGDCIALHSGKRALSMTEKDSYSEYHALTGDDRTDEDIAQKGYMVQDWKGFDAGVCDFVNDRIERIKFLYKADEGGNVCVMKVVNKK